MYKKKTHAHAHNRTRVTHTPYVHIRTTCQEAEVRTSVESDQLQRQKRPIEAKEPYYRVAEASCCWHGCASPLHWRMLYRRPGSEPHQMLKDQHPVSRRDRQARPQRRRRRRCGGGFTRWKRGSQMPTFPHGPHGKLPKVRWRMPFTLCLLRFLARWNHWRWMSNRSSKDGEGGRERDERIKSRPPLQQSSGSVPPASTAAEFGYKYPLGGGCPKWHRGEYCKVAQLA